MHASAAPLYAGCCCPAGIFVGIRHNVPPVSFAEPPRGRGGSNKLPLALIAAAPALHAADEAAAAAEAGRNANAVVPQLLVEELNVAPSWELQAYMPGAATGAGAAAAHGGSSSSAGYSRGGNGSHFQQQQQQQYNSSSKWGSSGGSGGGYKQERRGNGSSSSSSGSSMAPQSLPGSLGLVQQQLADVLQPQVGGWAACSETACLVLRGAGDACHQRGARVWATVTGPRLVVERLCTRYTDMRGCVLLASASRAGAWHLLQQSPHMQ
jgi:hypothetical protein